MQLGFGGRVFFLIFRYFVFRQTFLQNAQGLLFFFKKMRIIERPKKMSFVFRFQGKGQIQVSGRVFPYKYKVCRDYFFQLIAHFQVFFCRLADYRFQSGRIYIRPRNPAFRPALGRRLSFRLPGWSVLYGFTSFQITFPAEVISKQIPALGKSFVSRAVMPALSVQYRPAAGRCRRTTFASFLPGAPLKLLFAVLQTTYRGRIS